MSERQHLPHRSGPGRARRSLRTPRASTFVHDGTVPVPPVPAVAPEPTILGFPADEDPPPAPEPVAPPGTVAGPAPAPVAVRRSEWFGAIVLLLAGTASLVSLGLPWWRGAGTTGLTLVEQGLGILGSGLGPLGRSGLWQPVAVLLGGALLLVLGLLLIRPARTHRVVGLLALLATLAVAVGVVVPIADANWITASFGPGMWLAVAVAVLGLLGAVKAMETAPRLGQPPG